MTRQSSVSSVTQTWIVSRGQRRNQVPAQDDDGEDQTVTIYRPSITLLAKSSMKASAEQLTLSFGIHKFSLETDGELRRESEIEGRSDFEIDVNAAGAFLFSLSEELLARVNGRRVGWIRLRSDDVIEVGNWVLRVDPGELHAEDRTILARTSSGGDVREENARDGLKRFGGLALLLVVLPAMLMIALICGYMLAQNEMRDASIAQQEFLENQPSESSSIRVPKIVEQESAASEVEPVKPQNSPFGKQQFESVVELFRSGERKTACGNLKEAMETASKGVWRSKALLFLKRRCADS